MVRSVLASSSRISPAMDPTTSLSTRRRRQRRCPVRRKTRRSWRACPSCPTAARSGRRTSPRRRRGHRRPRRSHRSRLMARSPPSNGTRPDRAPACRCRCRAPGASSIPGRRRQQGLDVPAPARVVQPEEQLGDPGCRPHSPGGRNCSGRSGWVGRTGVGSHQSRCRGRRGAPHRRRQHAGSGDRRGVQGFPTVEVAVPEEAGGRRELPSSADTANTSGRCR